MKLLTNLINVGILLMPLMFSILASTRTSIILMAISIIMLFLLVLFVPLMRGNENVWMFILSTITLVPINIRLVKHIINLLSIDFESSFFNITVAITIYLVLFNIEEIVLGTIVRLLKPNQLEFTFDEL